MSKTITCSAPGKVLLVGGYIVLDPLYEGLVLSLSARIFTTISYIEPASTQHITVSSPQFPDATWEYEVSVSRIRTCVDCTSRQDNPFVREALITVLTYFELSSAFRSIRITILADNQYYSLPPNPKGGRFSKSTHSISETPKTGLGSSAALITSLCSALFLFHSSDRQPLTELDERENRTIHNLAQIAHSRAQGKIGSGFDVASAVYGSCIYSRFPASLIESLPAETSRSFSSALKDLVDANWPMKIQTVQLRPKRRLLMGDVKKGSSTPNMVRRVVACEDAVALWPSLALSNSLLIACLVVGTEKDINQPDIEIARAALESTYSVRSLLQGMGQIAEVDIEPEEQTELLNQTVMKVGVISCGVPGAGGHDAIFTIVQTDPPEKSLDAIEEDVKTLWEANGVELLKVTADGNGIQVEKDFDCQSL